MDITFKGINEESKFDMQNNSFEFPATKRSADIYNKVFKQENGEIVESEEHVEVFKKFKESGLFNEDEERLLEEFYNAIFISCDIAEVTMDTMMDNLKNDLQNKQ